jgi:cytochrome c oxidase subunit IV
MFVLKNTLRCLGVSALMATEQHIYIKLSLVVCGLIAVLSKKTCVLSVLLALCNYGSQAIIGGFPAGLMLAIANQVFWERHQKILYPLAFFVLFGSLGNYILAPTTREVLCGSKWSLDLGISLITALTCCIFVKPLC